MRLTGADFQAKPSFTEACEEILEEQFQKSMSEMHMKKLCY